jgi:hypothetical protein
MQKLQRHWRPDPFYFQDQITFQGRPTGVKKYPYEHITKGMVDKLRAVTRARRRIWDVEARKHNMRFPIKDTDPEPFETFGAAAHINEIQQTLTTTATTGRATTRSETTDAVFGTNEAAYHTAQPQPQDTRFQDHQDRHADAQDHPTHPFHREQDTQEQQHNHYNQHHDHHHQHHHHHHHQPEPHTTVDPQEALLLPQPSPDTFDMPVHINNAVIKIQTYVRAYQAYHKTRASLSYHQLMAWSRLHRNSVYRAHADEKRAYDTQLGKRIAKLQAMYRGWRGRGKAKYVKHRVWSAATLLLQQAIVRPYLARKKVHRLRMSNRWCTMAAKMVVVQQVQRWYRCRREGRLARVVLQVLKQNKVRLKVIKRLSFTWGSHICSTGLWNAKKEVKKRQQDLQWASKYATMLQAVIRARLAKKITVLLRTQKQRRLRRRLRSAIIIQSLYRGYSKRGEVVKRAYYVVQEAARRRWVVRSSDDVHRKEILTNEKKEKDRLMQHEIEKKLRANVLRYTIQETPDGRIAREKGRNNQVPESVREWYSGPHFSRQELFGEGSLDSPTKRETKEDQESAWSSGSGALSSDDDDNDSPRYW